MYQLISVARGFVEFTHISVIVAVEAAHGTGADAVSIVGASSCIHVDIIERKTRKRKSKTRLQRHKRCDNDVKLSPFP